MSKGDADQLATPTPTKRAHRLKRAVRRFFDQIWVEFSIAILVLASVVLTLSELAYEMTGVPYNDAGLVAFRGVNDLITCVFVIELSFRFFAATSKKRFFREFWIDILAVLPIFRVFRTWRALRLLRLIRILRLLGVMSRLAANYPYVFRRGAMEYAAISGLLAITVVFGTISMMYFENPERRARVADRQAAAEQARSTPDQGGESVAGEGSEGDSAGETEEPDDFTLENSFWFSLYSLFAGEPVPLTPETRGGKVVTVFVMFMGLTIFAMFTGTFSAYMVDRFRSEGRVIDFDELHDHIVICGWNHKSEIIVQEYRATRRTKQIPIVVITELDLEAAGVSEWVRSQVVFLSDDFTRVAALERAGIHRAKTCIIMADTSGGRSETDVDARTILASLTVEKINPKVYTCAEILNKQYGTHLQMGNVNDYVVSGDYSAYMLAQSAMNRGLMDVIGELLTYQRGNEFYRYELPAKWIGLSFAKLMLELKEKHNSILVAVHPNGGKMSVNPRDHEFAQGDEIVIIASSEVDLSRKTSGL